MPTVAPTTAAIEAAVAARDKAAAANPADVRRALLAIPRTIKGVTLRPVSLEDYLLLEEMASPLVIPGDDSTYYDVCGGAFVLSNEPETAQAAWEAGEVAWRKTVKTFARQFTPADLTALNRAVTACMAIGFDPLGAGDDKSDSKKKRRSRSGGRSR